MACVWTCAGIDLRCGRPGAAARRRTAQCRIDQDCRRSEGRKRSSDGPPSRSALRRAASATDVQAGLPAEALAEAGGAEGEISPPKSQGIFKNLHSCTAKRPVILKSPTFPPLISGCRVRKSETRRVSMDEARQRKRHASYQLARPTVAVR